MPRKSRLSVQLLQASIRPRTAGRSRDDRLSSRDDHFEQHSPHPNGSAEPRHTSAQPSPKTAPRNRATRQHSPHPKRLRGTAPHVSPPTDPPKPSSHRRSPRTPGWLALGFHNLTTYIARSLLETGGSEPDDTLTREEPRSSNRLCGGRDLGSNTRSVCLRASTTQDLTAS
jgi:hypothetical protein